MQALVSAYQRTGTAMELPIAMTNLTSQPVAEKLTAHLVTLNVKILTAYLKLIYVTEKMTVEMARMRMLSFTLAPPHRLNAKANSGSAPTLLINVSI